MPKMDEMIMMDGQKTQTWKAWLLDATKALVGTMNHATLTALVGDGFHAFKAKAGPAFSLYTEFRFSDTDLRFIFEEIQETMKLAPATIVEWTDKDPAPTAEQKLISTESVKGGRQMFDPSKKGQRVH